MTFSSRSGCSHWPPSKRYPALDSRPTESKTPILFDPSIPWMRVRTALSVATMKPISLSTRNPEATGKSCRSRRRTWCRRSSTESLKSPRTLHIRTSWCSVLQSWTSPCSTWATLKPGEKDPKCRPSNIGRGGPRKIARSTWIVPFWAKTKCGTNRRQKWNSQTSSNLRKLWVADISTTAKTIIRANRGRRTVPKTSVSAWNREKSKITKDPNLI